MQTITSAWNDLDIILKNKNALSLKMHFVKIIEPTQFITKVLQINDCEKCNRRRQICIFYASVNSISMFNIKITRNLLKKLHTRIFSPSCFWCIYISKGYKNASFLFSSNKNVSKCPRILVTMTNFVMVFINGGISYISIRLLTFITYVHCLPSVYLVMDNCA